MHIGGGWYAAVAGGSQSEADIRRRCHRRQPARMVEAHAAILVHHRVEHLWERPLPRPPLPPPLNDGIKRDDAFARFPNGEWIQVDRLEYSRELFAEPAERENCRL